MRTGQPSRRFRVIVCAQLCAAALVACRPRPTREEAFLARRVPVARLDSVLRSADSLRLPLADARLLFGLVADTGAARNAPHDTMSVTELLAWARAERVRKQQVEAAAAVADRARLDSLKHLLEPLLAVTVVKKSYMPRDPASEQFEDYISLAFAYKNTGAQRIHAFQGDATFLDTFGDSIYSAHLKVDLPLKPGQTRREPARIVRFNPFRVAHQRLRDTPLDKMKLVWQTTDVVFEDGSRLGLASDRGDH